MDRECKFFEENTLIVFSFAAERDIRLNARDWLRRLRDDVDITLSNICVEDNTDIITGDLVDHEVCVSTVVMSCVH